VKARLAVVITAVLAPAFLQAQTEWLEGVEVPFEFEASGWFSCVEVMADSAFYWAEEAYYQTVQSPLEVERCETVTEVRFSFRCKTSESGDRAAKLAWPLWLERMSKAGVPEATEILKAWREQGEPDFFDDAYQTHGGYDFHAELGIMEWTFYSAF
jgi:hypothetical protein